MRFAIDVLILILMFYALLIMLAGTFVAGLCVLERLLRWWYRDR
jgi:hypothetical protein